MARWVYFFDEKDPRDKVKLLGGKGANLAATWQMGAPIPEGFIITTAACKHFLATGSDEEIWSEVFDALTTLQNTTGFTFGNPEKPLLVSVRSGAPDSMPGIMETLLNVGMNEELVRTFNAQILGLGDKLYEALRTEFHNVSGGTELPDDCNTQVREAMRLVMQSWNSPKAKAYRSEYGLPDTGTAVVVQRMVIGLGEKSGTGIAVTRDLKLGRNQMTGNFRQNAQGTVAVGGRDLMPRIETLREISPVAFENLREWGKRFERAFRFAQEIEFTVENTSPWILQARDVVPNSFAAVRIAVDMVREEIMNRREALGRTDLGQLEGLASYKVLDTDGISDDCFLGYGVSQLASAAKGHIVLDANRLRTYVRAGRPCILVTKAAHLDTDQFLAMIEADGILTSLGGMTCHAATVATLRGKPHLVGCSNMVVDIDRRIVRFGNKELQEGDFISFDGVTEKIYEGDIPFAEIEAEGIDAVKRMLEWAKELSLISVWASADYRNSVETARQFKLDVSDRWSFAPFVSDKARSAHILGLIPDEDRIVQTPVPAHQEKQLRKLMLQALEENFWVGLRTGCEHQPLGSSPWAMGIKTPEDVDLFFKEVYKEWLKSVPEEKDKEFRRSQIGDFIMQDGPRPDLTEILVVSNPAGLGLPEEKHKHFVFRVVCSKGQLSVDLRLRTAQLRDIEHGADPHDLIRIQATLNFKRLDIGEKYHPTWRCIIGAHYCYDGFLEEVVEHLTTGQAAVNSSQIAEKVAYLLIDYGLASDLSLEAIEDGCVQLTRMGALSEEEIEAMTDPSAYRIIDTVARRVFEEWWAPSPAGLDLPYLMWGFDAAKGLYILEAQGGTDDAGQIWIRIYDLRGREEKEEASKAS